MINNVVSGGQQSESVIHTRVSSLFQILFPFRLLHSIEQSSLCYKVGFLFFKLILWKYSFFTVCIIQTLESRSNGAAGVFLKKPKVVLGFKKG